MTRWKVVLNIYYYSYRLLCHNTNGQSLAVADVKGLRVEDFESEEYLVPVVPDDPLLQIDWEEEGKIEEWGDTSLKERLELTEKQLLLTRTALDNALKDLNQMKETMRELTTSSTDPDATMETAVEEKDSYFSNYGHHGIHEEMLKVIQNVYVYILYIHMGKNFDSMLCLFTCTCTCMCDKVRMDSYELFITKNTEIFKDKVVLDIGCGTGILSLFAVKAGASHVFAIDQSPIIYKAVEIVRENGVDDKITFIRGEVESARLPVDSVDVLISEWMGYFLLFESMLDTVLYARDKWLNDKKNVYPNRCNMSLVAMGDEYEYNSKIKFWENVRVEPTVKLVDEYCLISTSDVIKKFDITTVKASDLDFKSSFMLTIKQNDTCYGLVGYFDIGFEVPSYRVYFSTSPQDTPTHWHQTIFFLNEPIQVQTGDLLRGSISCYKNKDCSRSLDIKIQMTLFPLSKESQELIIPELIYTLS
ncbi:PREDICTED: protein arginine N-methyltransferase 1-like [Amphimedon queenslandica]|uniref:type I protein arginine methyltransferase n=1 Tax=Amphimedon queenslandica TaxID=400682 RepID=A0AAN0JNY5_AMPQE|nr:PREDICTED: protein arginine N-methyltransferase 1-like [Amphimedon queenslandica]|eukprot:XP_019858498.1 PREDICTED: protein arginine N-methyltransferase 1-like [Amphimedon queenslandica]